MTHLIKIDSTDMYFGILTVMEYPDKGYTLEGVLTFLHVNNKGFVEEMDILTRNEITVKIIKNAIEKCEEITEEEGRVVQLKRY